MIFGIPWEGQADLRHRVSLLHKGGFPLYGAAGADTPSRHGKKKYGAENRRLSLSLRLPYNSPFWQHFTQGVLLCLTTSIHDCFPKVKRLFLFFPQFFHIAKNRTTGRFLSRSFLPGQALFRGISRGRGRYNRSAGWDGSRPFSQGSSDEIDKR